MLKVYRQRNVFDAALHRIRWLYREFPHVRVSFSGGKDSTICLQMALLAAEAEGRLPVEVMFVDQEAEWQAVIDYIRATFADPRVQPFWYQMPIKLFNATSAATPWLQCWEEGATWMRPREPNAITENVYGTDRFKELFEATLAHDYPDEPACTLGGMRADENPARRLGFTMSETYKGVTWGAITNSKLQHYLFCPIYDWHLRDVWTAIARNHWPYCSLYDTYFRYGVSGPRMRVSNLHHEGALATMNYLQELEPATWEALITRLPGIHSAGQLAKSERPKQLPSAFPTWIAYRDYLLENLILDPDARDSFRKQFARHERHMDPYFHPALIQSEIDAICANDHHGSNLNSTVLANLRYTRRGTHRSPHVPTTTPASEPVSVPGG